MVQWLSLCLPMQRAWVQSLVGELDPTSRLAKNKKKSQTIAPTCVFTKGLTNPGRGSCAGKFPWHQTWSVVFTHAEAWRGNSRSSSFPQPPWPQRPEKFLHRAGALENHRCLTAFGTLTSCLFNFLKLHFVRYSFSAYVTVTWFFSAWLCSWVKSH